MSSAAYSGHPAAVEVVALKSVHPKDQERLQRAVNQFNHCRTGSDAMLTFCPIQFDDGSIALHVFHLQKITVKQMNYLYDQLRSDGITALPRICFDASQVHRCDDCAGWAVRIEFAPLDRKAQLAGGAADFKRTSAATTASSNIKMSDEVLHKLQKCVTDDKDWTRVFGVIALLHQHSVADVEIEEDLDAKAATYRLKMDLRGVNTVEASWLANLCEAYPFYVYPEDAWFDIANRTAFVEVRKHAAPPRNVLLVTPLSSSSSRRAKSGVKERQRSRSRSPRKDRRHSRSRSRSRSRD
jgi:hypothetical protein